MKRLSVAILLALCFLPFSSCTEKEWKSNRPNILFLMLDTLRADHLSGYGYERSTTPVLDAFAKENLKAAHALTAAPWTPASVASMFTGLYPTSHGMVPPNDRSLAKRGLARLSSSLETLPERLKSLGYQTAGVSPNPWITKQFGYAQGFDEFHFIAREPANKIAESGREIIEKWESKGQAKPFFMYLHFLDPHNPYAPPTGFDKRYTGPLSKSPFTYSDDMQRDINLYDGEIAFMDQELGKFFDYLKKKGLYDDLMIIIVADHGEQFLEHGNVRHGNKPYNEEAHVPLIIKTNRKADSGRIINESVSTVDILPTILARLGEQKPKDFPGVSLMDEKAVKLRRGVLTEVRRIYDMKAITDNAGRRLIMQVPYSQSEPDPMKSLEAWAEPQITGIFDTRKDYACSKSLENKAIHARLKGTFDEIFSGTVKMLASPSEGGEEIKDETLEQLKSLGYLQ